MEPTISTTSSGKSSKAIIWIIIVIIVIIAIIFAMRNKTEYPLGDNSSGESMTNSQLEAEINGATSFDDQASLNAIDQEFKK